MALNVEPTWYERLGCSRCLSAEALGFDFSMAFQPIINARAKTIFAQEALVRGLLNEPAASVFQHVNEDNLYRFDQSCRVKAIELASRFAADSLISINFMPRAVYRPELCIRTTLEAAEMFNVDRQRIMFEFNESERVDDTAHLKSIIESYKTMGFKTAIDDFGAGYSGLNQLTEFTPDLIKLDMKLIRGIDHCTTRQSIVRSIVTMCADLGIEIIAEGIETKDEHTALFDLGIYLLQGYFYARPSFETFTEIDKIYF